MTDPDPYLNAIAKEDDDLPESARRDREGDDERSDLEQAVESRSDAVERGEGGPEPEPMTAPGDYAGVAGTGGEVTNQDWDAQ